MAKRPRDRTVVSLGRAEPTERAGRGRPQGSRHLKPGKVQFDDVYDLPDPRGYFRELQNVEYETPGHGQGVFRRLVATQRARFGREDIAVLDLCCSYGVNAALLNCDLTLGGLYQRYCSPELASLSSDELAAADRDFYAERRNPSPATVVGVDASSQAVSYATEVGLLEAGWRANLEAEGPSDGMRARLGEVDLVTVTGGIGYISQRTFSRVLECRTNGRPPWVAAFALRWVDYTPVARLLASQGLVTEKLTSRTFRQRRFAHGDERRYALAELQRLGIDPAGKETDDCYHAELYVSRPAPEAQRTPIDELLHGVV